MNSFVLKRLLEFGIRKFFGADKLSRIIGTETQSIRFKIGKCCNGHLKVPRKLGLHNATVYPNSAIRLQIASAISRVPTAVGSLRSGFMS